MISEFLAMLDYISRAHEIEICRSSVRRPSIRVAIISISHARISFTFRLLYPLDHMQRHFLLLFFNEYFSSLTWDPMGAKISNRYPPTPQRFLHFLPNGPLKTTFGIFLILKKLKF